MSDAETTTVCAPAVVIARLPEHAVETWTASRVTLQVEVFTPELTPPLIGSVMLQLKLNGVLTVPEAGLRPIVGAVVSMVKVNGDDRVETLPA